MLNKKYLWPAVVVLVLLAILVLGTRKGGVEPDTNESGTPGPGSPSVTVKTSGTAEGASYTALVAQYKDRHIQFDQYCQASPKNPTYKNGTTLLFDNRSGEARTIKIGGAAYSFAGYGYKIITLSKPSGSLPYTVKLDCGSAVNVGQILLQK